jgi:hypothetical protein
MCEIEQLLKEAENMALNTTLTPPMCEQGFVCLSDNAITEAACCMEIWWLHSLSWNLRWRQSGIFHGLCEKIQNSLSS